MRGDVRDLVIGVVLSIIIVAIILSLIVLLIWPAFSYFISICSSLMMALATVLMVFVTYESYKTLTEIQRASLEPALAVSLCETPFEGEEDLSWYGVVVKNDGHGIAKNVTLWINWAYRKIKSDRVEKLDFSETDYYGEMSIDIGNIASKEETYISQLPLPTNLNAKDVYGVKLTVTCEDIFGSKKEKYSDTKRIYLKDAEMRSLK